MNLIKDFENGSLIGFEERMQNSNRWEHCHIMDRMSQLAHLCTDLLTYNLPGAQKIPKHGAL